MEKLPEGEELALLSGRVYEFVSYIWNSGVFKTDDEANKRRAGGG